MGEVDYGSIMTYFSAFTDINKDALDFTDIAAALEDIGYGGHRTIEGDTVGGPTHVHAKRNLNLLGDAAVRSETPAE